MRFNTDYKGVLNDCPLCGFSGLSPVPLRQCPYCKKAHLRSRPTGFNLKQGILLREGKDNKRVSHKPDNLPVWARETAYKVHDEKQRVYEELAAAIDREALLKHGRGRR